MAIAEICPADRIRQLSDISEDVATMLRSAGQAINSLTDRPLETPESDDTDTGMVDSTHTASVNDRKEVFTTHTTAFFTGLQGIVARLRRQAYALEEAGIVIAESATFSSSAQQAGELTRAGQTGKSATQQPERLTNGGLGNLNIGWLNSRRNIVGAEKEDELMGEAKELLEDVLGKD